MAETAHGDAAGPLSFGVLGPIQILRDGQPLPLGGRRQRAVLAVLLLHANAVVPMHDLVDQVWSENPPDGAVGTLQTYVFHLRRVLEPQRGRTPAHLLVSRDPGYLLALDGCTVDATVFANRMRAGQTALAAGGYDEAARLLRAGLALWRGPALADLTDYEFARNQAARLEGLRLEAIETRVEADLMAGRHDQLVPELAQLVSRYPLHERLHGQLILALYRAGRQADALAAYSRLRKLLLAELGVDPGEPLQQLHQAVLAHDPVLARSPPAASAAPAVGEPPPGAMPMPRRHRRRRLIVAVVAVALVLVGAGLGSLSVRNRRPEVLRLASNHLALLDVAHSRALADVAVGSSPASVAASGGSVWVANTEDGTVSQVDQATHAVTQTVRVGRRPEGVAVASGSVWVANTGDDTVTRINLATAQPVQTIPVGGSPVAVAAAGGAVWVANRFSDSVTRIRPTDGQVVATIHVGNGPVALAGDSDTLWVANANAGTVSPLEMATNTAAPAIPVGVGPQALALGRGALWVANYLDGTVWRIDPVNRRPVALVPVDGPTSLAVGRDGVWVGAEFGDTVSRIDPTTNRVVQTLRVAGAPRGLAVVGSRLWVSIGTAGPGQHRGGTLRIASGFIFTVDPATAYQLDSTAALNAVYDGLTALRRVPGADGYQLVPDLAVALPRPSADGRTYVFRLRRGIRYSNGASLRAGDLRRGLERQFTANGGQGQHIYDGIVGAGACQHTSQPARCDLSRGIVTDDAAGTVTFHLTKPDPEFLYRLSLLLSSATAPGAPTTELSASPLPGTGPYRLASFTAAKGGHPVTKWVLVRNSYFHEWSRAAQPDGFPDRIEASDTGTRAVGLVAAGQADFATPTPTQVRDLQVRYPGRVRIGTTPTLLRFALNTGCRRSTACWPAGR